MFLHYTAAEGLAGLVSLDPDASEALHHGLASGDLATRFCCISSLAKSEPKFTPADASTYLVGEFDALDSDSDSFVLGYIRDWIVKNAKPTGVVERMSPAERQAVAKAIGRVFDRLARADSANSQGFYFNLLDGLVALGSDAKPAVHAARAAAERFKGIRESEAQPALARLDAIKSDAAGR